MRIVAVASQKGGSGKTTLAGHLAVHAERMGAGPVVLIDIDPQASLAGWWNDRVDAVPALAEADVDRLPADLEMLRRQGFKLAIIDTPPAVTIAVERVIDAVELVLVPARPSPHDLRAAGATVEQCARAGKPLVFIVNAATPGARITQEIAVALSHHGVVAPTIVHHRVDFARSMMDGRTACETDPAGRSAAEIADLWTYVTDRLERNFRRTVFSVPGPRGSIGGFGRRAASL